MRRMYSQSQINQIVKNAIANGLLDDVDISVRGITSKGITNTGNIATTGKVTGSEIVEDMSGYSISTFHDLDTWDSEFVYIGVVKNGNKLTLVCNGKLKRTADTTDLVPKIIQFNLPENVASKIVPIEIQGTGRVDQKAISLFSTATGYIQVPAYLTKTANNLYLNFRLADLVVDTEYVYRYEVTFLLSENLIPQE